MRQRSKRLFDAAAGEDGFPAAAEAWRSCLKDTFDMEGFRNLVSGLRDGTIKISFFATRNPSPFSQGVIRQETGVLIYEYDERPDLRGRKGGEDRLNRFDRALSLSDRAIAEALGEAALRPVLAAGTVSDFVSRLRRELPGWAPDDPLGLAEWVKERIALPLDEWELLNTVLPGGLKANLETDPGLGGRICVVLRKGAAVPSVVHREWRKDWEKDPLPFLGPWLRYEGPLPLSRITGVFGVTAARAEDALLALAEAEELVRDVALEGRKDEGFFCDRENLDLLLRLSRKKARPRIREKPAVLLSPFLALRQGLLRRPSAAGGNAADRETAAETGSASAWKSLFCLAGPVKLWETGFLPARIENYNGSMLDRKIKEGRLLWYGAGKERAGICRPEDLELILPEITGLKDFPQGQGDFFHRPRDFWEIREASGLSSRDCAARLWDEAWRGRLSADSFEPVRQGMEFGFIPGDSGDFGGGVFAGTPQAYSPGQIRRRIPRALRDRWKTGAPVRGNWFSLEGESPGGDPLEEEELSRDRIRLLLERWGILCRPLLEREAPPLYWSRLLPAMRRMELSGELVTGRFFSGINSLQFAAPHIVPELEKAEVLKDIYWMNAADPASTAGLDAEGLDPKLPSRSALSRLCFRGSELIALSNRSGREARIFTGPGDPNIPVIVDFFKAPRLRNVLPEKKLCIETINGKPAAGAYAEAFKAAGFIPDRGKLFLW
jgi:ATP-dependent Lhr-like helicase